ncbi:hypothetical protein BGZ76_002586 [Entomortierella beljakovae]|nr:hypothetical protein BGZ76_002586 [Entomortierella beljakovae]
MDSGQKAYLEDTRGSQICIGGFVAHSKVILEASDFDNLWVKTVIPFLMNHSSKNKVECASRLQKATKNERRKDFKEAIEFHKHTEALFPNAAEEIKIVADIHTERFKKFAKTAYRLRPSTESSSRSSLKRARENEQISSTQEDTAAANQPAQPSDSLLDDAANENETSQSKKPKSLTGILLEEGLASQSSQGDSDFDGSSQSSARSSLNSIDFQFINHLVGPGTTSSRLRTSGRLVIEDTDVSEALMSARRSVVKHQSEITSVSDLLTLNFIFNLEFMEKHLPSNIFEAMRQVPALTASAVEIKALAECSMFAACHSFLETKLYIRENAPHGTIIGEVLRSYTTRPALWHNTKSTSLPYIPQNEDTYIEDVVRNIIVGVFGDLDVKDHWTKDPLPTPQGFEEVYLPDYFAEKDGFPFILAEVKKPEIITDEDLAGDKRKLPSMMKLALDRMLEAGVESPTVIGLLVFAGRCQIFSMGLEHEALYILKEVGEFELPRNNLQLGLLFAAIVPLLIAQDTATRMVASIKRRKGINRMPKWQRLSYYVKGIKILAPLTPPEDL